MKIDVPVTIEGTVTRRASLWVQLTDYLSFEEPRVGLPLVIEPGAVSATIPFEYEADDAYNPYLQLRQVTLLARRNAVTGNYDGSVVIEEDDPPPRLTVDSKNVSAAEGASLQWTFRLSAPMKGNAFWPVPMFSPGGRFPELDTDDVPVSFLALHGVVPPRPPVPLSQVGLFFGIEFEPGERVATVTLPTQSDTKTEPTEGVYFRLDAFGDPVIPRPIELTGKVLATPTPSR
jgi:hypothetical protein